MSSELSMRLGELLVTLGMIKPAELSEAAQVAVETGLPLGRVLVMSDLVSEAELQAVVQAQSLLKDRLLSLDTASEAIKIVKRNNGTLKQALKEIGWTQQETVPSNKLGEFLLDAEVIDEDQLNHAMAASEETGLPLGRVLVLNNAISEELLSAALSAQVFVRDLKITREQAVQGLRAARLRQITIEQSLADAGIYKPAPKEKVRLGELFVIAGLLNERDVINALELGLVREQPIGEVLVESGMISKELLDTGVRLQEIVDNNTLNVLQASQVLRQIALTGISMAQAIAELGLLRTQPEEKVRLGELLKMAGFITERDIQKALDLSQKNASLMGKILLINGVIDESLLHAALRCQFLLREHFLKQEQAIVALTYCHKMKCTFDDALNDLGWTISTRSVPPESEAVTFDTAPS